MVAHITLLFFPLFPFQFDYFLNFFFSFIPMKNENTFKTFIQKIYKRVNETRIKRRKDKVSIEFYYMFPYFLFERI